MVEKLYHGLRHYVLCSWFESISMRQMRVILQRKFGKGQIYGGVDNFVDVSVTLF